MTPTNPPRLRLRLRLALAPILWSAGGSHLALRTFARWERFAWPARSVEDRLRYVFSDSTRMLYQSAFWAIAATVLAWLLVRLIVGPIVRHRLAPNSPGGEAVPREFLLEPGETVRFERPSTFLMEGTWMPGTLLLTDRRIRFLPRDWTAPPWSIDRRDVLAIDLVPVPARLAAIVSGLPDRLAIVDRSSSTVFATLLDPAEFADRICLS